MTPSSASRQKKPPRPRTEVRHSRVGGLRGRLVCALPRAPRRCRYDTVRVRTLGLTRPGAEMNPIREIRQPPPSFCSAFPVRSWLPSAAPTPSKTASIVILRGQKRLELPRAYTRQKATTARRISPNTVEMLSRPASNRAAIPFRFSASGQGLEVRGRWIRGHRWWRDEDSGSPVSPQFKQA